jgi:hypothetical protein
MTIIKGTVALAATFALVGCLSDVGGGGDNKPEPGVTSTMSALLCARKMSLDLTHGSPAADDLKKLDAGDMSLEQLADKYLASEEFKAVSFDWMRAEFPPTASTTAETDIEEPARIMHHILMTDKDWREVMTATYTVSKTGTEAAIVDRPAAGIISTRYSLQSTFGSFRRNWAGRFERQFAGITLVAVTLPAGDMTDVSPDGLASNPNCAGCHVHPTYGIDHLARFAECYGEDGLRKAGCTDPEGSFLLQTGKGLPDLGRIVANTNEFKSQAVNFFFKRLFGRDIAREEADYYSDAAKAFADSGYHARELIKHIVTSEAYCAR